MTKSTTLSYLSVNIKYVREIKNLVQKEIKYLHPPPLFQHTLYPKKFPFKLSSPFSTYSELQKETMQV